MQKENVAEARGFSNEDLDLLAYLLAEEGVELDERPTIPRREPEAEIPLSFAQQRLWFLDQLQPGSAVYHLPTAIRVSGPLDLPALEKTFTEIVRRHEILRTTFSTIEGNPRQIIAPPAPVSFPVVDVSHLPAEAQQPEIRQLMREEVTRSFDLSTGPLMRTLLIRSSDEEHVVIVTIHHIISDGWSSTILVREISALYQEFTTGRPSGLAELSLQYGDYAIWQHESMQGEELQSQLDYWRQQLSNLQVLALPLDRPRPATQTFRGAKHTVMVPRAVDEELKELAQSEQATLFMVLLAAFAVLLSRYSGQTDITIGTPIASRRRTELEPLIGFFANTLVLRLDTADSSSFRELISRARKVCLEAYAHQDLPFEMLVEELQPERSLSHTPLFQTVLVMQNVPRVELSLESLRLQGLGTDVGMAKFDLTLVAEESEQGLTCTFEYNTDLFEATTIARLLNQLGTLLGAAAANPDRPLAALPLLNDVERRDLLAEWTGKGENYRQSESLHQLFEQQVARTPNAVAITFEDAQLTYAELNVRANHLAHFLRAKGVGPETLVALCVDRSVEMIVAILGVLKAGGAYVPLESTNPKERLAFMLEDSGAPILLTQSHLSDLLPSFAGTIVTLDAEPELFLEQNQENPRTTITPDNTAYIIYTSGSTGRAKGTYITHSNVTRLFSSTEQWFNFNSEDVWTLFHSYAFDFSVWEIWGALLYGGRLVIVPYWISRTPEAFYDLLSRERVTILNQTPTAFRQLMHVEEQTSPELVLRAIVFGGEALEPTNLKPWVERHGDERPQLINMYGITETTVHVTYRRLLRSDIENAAGSAIGVPIPDLELYVLDELMEPVPIGATGEMYVGGEGLARGYLPRAELTAQRFVPHPFSATPGARLYKTGDLGRYLGGEFEYFGRCDQQVKIRGFRIELGEIEVVLGEHQAVREVIVVDYADANGERRLVAYVTLKEAIAIDQLRAFMKERLPEHMIPAAFVVLDNVPLTPNGKLDRRALPAPRTDRPELEDSYIAPRTETEALLASIWANVLNLERVGVADNFFTLGGDSIRSVRLLAKARERGLEFSLQQLFRHQTISELAREIAATETRSLPLRETRPFELISEDDRRKMPPGVVDSYPLTMMQGGMLFHMALAPETTVYHNINSWHLRAAFDRECFEECVNRAVARHPILRTYFDLTSYSEPLQLVQESARLDVGVTDLRQYSEEEQSELLDQYIARERSSGFDIGHPPLLRFHIHLRTDESFQFTLTESHPIFDGWSLNSTLSEIFTNYFTLLKGHVLPPIAPVSVTFRDFVLMERLTLESEECRNFWEERLRGSNATRVPRLPAPHREAGDRRIREEYVLISTELSKGLHAVARSLKVPLKSVLLAAHQKVLSLLSGETDVVTGLVTNGRPEALDGDEVRGMFLNTVPFRLRVPDGTWSDLIQTTFEAEWEMLPYRRYPLLAMQRQMGGQRLFEAQFNYVHFHVLEGVLGSGDVEVLRDVKKRAFEEAHFPLTAAFGQSVIASQVNLMLQYDSTELGEEQIRAIASYYLETLERIAKDPAERHNSRTSIPLAERRRLLTDWNDTARAYPDNCVHELFEAQAKRTPDNVAVTSEEASLTYRELNKRANQLAHYLRDLGVSADQPVGICIERSAAMVVALLGILKAGGAYVPLDPHNPAERLSFILADASASVIVTTDDLRNRLPAQAKVVCLDSDWGTIATRSREEIAAGVTPDNLAYVIYTSGTTGRPKGVMISHRALTNHLFWMQQEFPLGPDDRLLQKTVYSFDASVWELFNPLIAGAQLVMAIPGGQQDSSYLVGAIAAHGITVLQVVPSMLHMMLEEPELSRLGTLKRMFCGGEVLSPELEKKFFDSIDAELINLYGPTEVTVDSIYWRCEPELQRSHVPIGRPITNDQVFILDKHLQPVPPGVPGELYIGGVGLARGYWRRSELTAERFVPHPFAAREGERLYRTGDLGRYHADGSIEYLGRIDHQVKLRGMRIELGEIEAALREHTSVREGVVILHGNGMDAELVAYIVPTSDGHSEALRKYLDGKLPRYMVPTVFVELERLPLMPNGKLDRHALPAPNGQRSTSQATFVAPRNELERTVANIWREVLGVEQVGIHDNFFELGGHSLKLLQVHLKLRQILQRELPLFELFQYPTVSALASHLQTGGDGESLEPSEQRGERRKQQSAQQRQRRRSASGA